MADMKLFNMRTKNGAVVSDGPTLHLSHEHIRALKMDTPLSHGTEVEFHGVGHVSDSSSHEDGEGEPRHSMTITLLFSRCCDLLVEADAKQLLAILPLLRAAAKNAKSLDETQTRRGDAVDG